MAISHAQTLVLFLISLLILPAFADTDFKMCRRRGEYPIKVKTVKISPDPIIRSGNANITVTGYTTKDIPDGVLVILDLSAVFHVASKTYSLCDITACPVKPGPIVLTFSNVFTKKELELGAYFVRVGIAEDNMKMIFDPMMCVDFACKIRDHASLLRQVVE